MFILLYEISAALYHYFRDNYPVPGYRRRIIDKLLYSRVHMFVDSFFISSIWFDVVDFVSKTDIDRTEIFKPNEWIQKFTEAPELGKHHLDPKHFEAARAEFDRDPRDFVHCLEKYSVDLRVRDIAESILIYCADRKQRQHVRRARLNCWLKINAEIRNILDTHHSTATIAPYAFPDPDSIRNVLDELKTENDLQDTGDGLIRFLNGCISNYMPQEDQGMC